MNARPCVGCKGATVTITRREYQALEVAAKRGRDAQAKLADVLQEREILVAALRDRDSVIRRFADRTTLARAARDQMVDNTLTAIGVKP